MNEHEGLDRCYICGEPIFEDEMSETYEGHRCHSVCVDDEERHERETQEVA